MIDHLARVKHVLLKANNGFFVLGSGRKVESLEDALLYIQMNPLEGEVSLWVRNKVCIIAVTNGPQLPSVWTDTHRIATGEWGDVHHLFESYARML